MLNLFRARKTSGVEIVRDHGQLFKRMGDVVKSNQRALDSLGERHREVDICLSNRIEDVLRPIIGQSGIDHELWFQSADHHGDGIRHLEFKPSAFPISAVSELQGLLTDESACFGILCWAPTAEDEERENQQCVVIFASQLLLTPGLARAATDV
jgi:hypothetical protein